MTVPTGKPIVIPIDEANRPGEARRAATALATLLGFDETTRGKVALVTTELATNLFKHAVGGELIVQPLDDAQGAGLEVMALDRGPGIVDVARCMADGFSTAGSPGNGLGAVARLSSAFDLHSVAGAGTAVLSRFYVDAPASAAPRAGIDVGAVCLSLAGEEVSGDAWAMQKRGELGILVVVDGLGHGPQAAEASLAAIRSFHDCAGRSPAEMIQQAHQALRSTRGAAMAVAEVDLGRREVRYAGVGNISASIVSASEGTSKSLVSHNGTVGHTMRKVQEFLYPWPAGGLLVMHSDGLASHWRLERYPGLAIRHASLVAGTLYRDARRERDDVTVLVAREQETDAR